jgi:hypothetical protein
MYSYLEILDRLNGTPVHYILTRVLVKPGIDYASAVIKIDGVKYTGRGKSYKSAKYKCAKEAYEGILQKANTAMDMKKELDVSMGSEDAEKSMPAAPTYLQVVEKYHRFKGKKLKWTITKEEKSVKVSGVGMDKEVARGRCVECAKNNCARKMFEYLRNFSWHDEMCDASPSAKCHLGDCPPLVPSEGVVEIELS